MAGHSKWANIQHRKKKVDAKRGKIFTKIIRLITVAARVGGADPDANPRLREAIIKAKAVNMPNDNIDRAIKKGAGEAGGADMEEILYEGYGPAGVAVMVECLTDNRNRTVSEVRHAFSKSGGNLGTSGSVAYLFTKQGQISFASGTDEDAVMEVALEEGAEDVTVNDDGSIDVVTAADDFAKIKDALDAKGLEADYADLSMAASLNVPLELEAAEKLQRLIDVLEDLDDVQNVFSNAEMSEETSEQLG